MAELTEEQKAAQVAADAAKKSTGEGAKKLAADVAGEAAAAKKGKYEVLRPVNHDHVLYPEGGIVKLSEDEAQPLLAHRAIKPATKEVAL